jgi:hypothetical protein
MEAPDLDWVSYFQCHSVSKADNSGLIMSESRMLRSPLFRLESKRKEKSMAEDDRSQIHLGLRNGKQCCCGAVPREKARSLVFSVSH